MLLLLQAYRLLLLQAYGLLLLLLQAYRCQQCLLCWRACRTVLQQQACCLCCWKPALPGCCQPLALLPLLPLLPRQQQQLGQPVWQQQPQQIT
jgi:hypothetical protein